jgi:hypothetical protein
MSVFRVAALSGGCVKTIRLNDLQEQNSTSRGQLSGAQDSVFFLLRRREIVRANSRKKEFSHSLSAMLPLNGENANDRLALRARHPTKTVK